jgi:Pyruvate/2-oxoacid:ferredoxin oxidoreductase delta subunit
MKKSTYDLFKIHGRNVYLKIDGFLYLKYISGYVNVISHLFRVVSRIINKKNSFLFLPIIKFLTSRYHGKIMIHQDASKIITHNVDLVIEEGLAKSVIPYNKAYNIVLRNPNSIVAVRCACRDANNHDCEPAKKCLIIGEPIASFMLDHNKNAEPERINVDNALKVLDLCRCKGYIANAYCKDGAGNGMYAICNCDPECCVSISAHRLFNRLEIKESSLAHSGYIAEINLEKCINTKDCIQICPFNAISFYSSFNKPRINSNLCMGCGTCVINCKEKAITMKKALDKGIPLDINELLRIKNQ